VAVGANDKRYNGSMDPHYFAHNLQQQLDQITNHGFCVMDNFLSPSVIDTLASEVLVLQDSALLHAANTGRAQTTMNNKFRGDSIYWLNEAEASPAQQTYFDEMERLRYGLNRHLYLGLDLLESHLALYPIGAGYQKHLDRFKANDNSQLPQRQISCILYLNKDWLEEDGGYLRLYLNADDATDGIVATASSLDIAPIAGRLVMFLSDTFYHEVMPANRARMSLTGWFLNR
jgi:SM-20-related protein